MLASALARDPDDTSLVILVAALQAWFGQDAELAATCRRALEFAKDTKEATTAERTAKICCLRPSDDKSHRDATLALARQAVKLGTNNPYLPYFLMALGMAEYRSGNDTAADEALLAAANADKQNRTISVTTAFYRALSLFRQGKAAEARQVATEAVSRMKPLPADENNPLTGGDADDLIAWMAYKEARALLKLETAVVTPAKPNGR